MRLPAKNWSDSLASLASVFRQTPDLRDPLRTAYYRYHRELHHLSLIWERLRFAVDAHEDHIKWLTERAQTASDVEDQTKWALFRNRTRFLPLDIENFFIHARILMDRVAAVVEYLLPGTLPSIRHPSFHARREFFLRKPNIPYHPDEDYARYMRERTGWFEAMLRDPRDLFVVHDVTSDHGGLVSGPNLTPRLIHRRSGPRNTNSEKACAKLIELREKYANRMGEVLRGMENPFELLGFFNRCASELEPEDLRMLRRIKEVTSAYSPDLNLLANEILTFLGFVGSHFLKRETSTVRGT